MTTLAATGRHAPAFLEQLKALPELKPFPAAAARLIKACQDPGSNSKTLAEIIRCDATLALRLLRVANSSAYGFSKEIRTVDHAVVVLGFRAVKELALSLAAAETFGQGETAHEARQALWQHSLACGTIARLLAAQFPDVSSEEAFLAGIVHDVGKLVFYDLAAETYLELMQNSVGTGIEAEKQAFGISHSEIGRQCGEQWGLPDAINAAIGNHHEPLDKDQTDDLVIVVGLANRLAKVWDLEAGEPADIVVPTEVELWLDESQFAEIQCQAHEEFGAVQQACQP